MKLQSKRPVLCAGFAAIALASSAPAATLTVNALVTPMSGGIFNYDFTFINDCPDDDFGTFTLNAPVRDSILGPSLTVPSGDFQANYASNDGFVDFSSTTFTGFERNMTYSGFSLQTTGDPSSFFTTFEALSNTTFQPVSGAVTTTVIPEPSSAVLLGAFAFTGFLRRRRHS
jgi:hypothetical protein